MTGRERFQKILNRESDRCGFWHGDPNWASLDNIYSYFGVKDDFELGLKLGSGFRWVKTHEPGTWTNPDAPMFDFYGGVTKKSLGEGGVFADYTDADIADVEGHYWPDVKYCDFTGAIAKMDETIEAGQGVVTGMWSCFFHDICEFFGMENYFIKMHTDPDLVIAVTERVVDFYLQGNEKLFQAAGDRIDAFFFGNDFGSQLDLLISPEHFDIFVMPYFRKLTDLAHKYGRKVLLHSCGAINRVIPRLIGAGVEALHPIQALARDMDAESLAKNYNGRIVFVGGVDTQLLLSGATPREVRDEVRRLKGLFGPNFVVSPSHESILPNVPPENILAMAEAAAE